VKGTTDISLFSQCLWCLRCLLLA